MGNDAVGGVGNNRGGVDSVGNNGGSVGNDGSGVHGVGNDGSMDGVGNDGGSGDVATSRLRGVDGLTSVLNGGNVSGQVVGVVGDGLDPAVGKVDGVRSSHGTSAIVGLGLLEVGLGVVVGHGVGVGVGGGLGEVGGGNGVHHGGVLGGGGGSGHKGKGDEGLEVVIFKKRISLNNTFSFPFYTSPNVVNSHHIDVLPACLKFGGFLTLVLSLPQQRFIL